MSGPISVVVVAYRAGDSLLRCLRSLEPAGDLELIVVDNGSESDEIERAAQLENVRVLAPGRNVGFAAGCNLGAAEATGDVLVFLNPDTVVGSGALPALGRTLDDRSIGIAMARLRLLDRPELLNSGGTVVHVSGLAWAGRYGEPAETIREVEDVAAPSGAAMAIRRELFEELGGFTEELFMYLEDTELGWRARLHGLRVAVVPSADVYHDYEFSRNETKLALLERNREIFTLTAYSLRLLLLLAPVLAATELAMLAIAGKQRWLGGKLEGWWWLARHAGWLRRHRRETQRLRRIPDEEPARFLEPALDPQMIELSSLVSPINAVMRAYWSVARRA